MKIALFSSIGDDISRFVDYYKNFLSDKCDLYLNYYGQNPDILFELQNVAKFVDNIYTTKFPSLLSVYKNSNLNEYDYILIFDDDFIVEKGDLFDIINLMSQYDIQVASACHSSNGKVSHNIMKHYAGDHIFRYTNFVEMNFPIFNKKSLNKYLQNYDGQLCGWGNDWWYLNVLNCNNEKNCAIIDDVIIQNPNNHLKKNLSIDSFMNRDDRHNEWKKTRDKIKLFEWQHKNLEFIYK